MSVNLDSVHAEIEDYLKSAGFAIFRGYARTPDTITVDWDSEKYPDYKSFLDVAKEVGVRLIVLHQRAFDASIVERAKDAVDESEDIDLDEQRTIKNRLNELTKYDGFTCAIEMSFDHENSTYLFELRAEWFEELDEMLAELSATFNVNEEDDEDDDESYGGYYSKN
jgi:hypothetical protein